MNLKNTKLFGMAFLGGVLFLENCFAMDEELAAAEAASKKRQERINSLRDAAKKKREQSEQEQAEKMKFYVEELLPSLTNPEGQPSNLKINELTKRVDALGKSSQERNNQGKNLK